MAKQATKAHNAAETIKARKDGGLKVEDVTAEQMEKIMDILKS